MGIILRLVQLHPGCLTPCLITTGTRYPIIGNTHAVLFFATSSFPHWQAQASRTISTQWRQRAVDWSTILIDWSTILITERPENGGKGSAIRGNGSAIRAPFTRFLQWLSCSRIRM